MENNLKHRQHSVITKMLMPVTAGIPTGSVFGPLFYVGVCKWHIWKPT